VTGVGDEVGWDFISRVTSSRISFSGFCKEMSRLYQTTNIMAAPFMAPNTFIFWFFGWMSTMKIDFRKEVDPFCGYNPKILACDGTHIGVSCKFQVLKSPCAEPDLNETVTPVHKR
jgi:hypothetical protein